jgi:uncharacterized protein (TIGR00369 family)
MTASPSPPRSVEEQTRLDDALRDLFEQLITFNQVLGLRIESVNPASVRGRFDMRPELVGHYLYGRLHGGVISATLDAMGGLAVTAGIGEKHPGESAEQIMNRFAKVGTIDLRVDFLRPGIGTCFYASATVVRLGGRVGTTQMRLENERGVLIATGAGAYVIS